MRKEDDFEEINIKKSLDFKTIDIRNSNGEFHSYESFCTATDKTFNFYKNIELYTNFQKPSKILMAKLITADCEITHQYFLA